MKVNHHYFPRKKIYLRKLIEVQVPGESYFLFSREPGEFLVKDQVLRYCASDILTFSTRDRDDAGGFDHEEELPSLVQSKRIKKEITTSASTFQNTVTISLEEYQELKAKAEKYDQIRSLII